jgi:hypothetical protein
VSNYQVNLNVLVSHSAVLAALTALPANAIDSGHLATQDGKLTYVTGTVKRTKLLSLSQGLGAQEQYQGQLEAIQ